MPKHEANESAPEDTPIGTRSGGRRPAKSTPPPVGQPRDDGRHSNSNPNRQR